MERTAIVIARHHDVHRFSSRENVAAHATLGKFVVSRADQFLQCIVPVRGRLVVHFHDDVTNDGGTYPFVIQSQANEGFVARVVFEDWPDSRADLLSLHIGGVTRNEQGRTPTSVAIIVSYRVMRCPGSFATTRNGTEAGQNEQDLGAILAVHNRAISILF
jgi:hypothetical protein